MIEVGKQIRKLDRAGWETVEKWIVAIFYSFKVSGKQMLTRLALAPWALVGADRSRPVPEALLSVVVPPHSCLLLDSRYEEAFYGTQRR